MSHRQARMLSWCAQIEQQSTRASDNKDTLSLREKEEWGRKGRRSESVFMTHDWKVHDCIEKYIFFLQLKVIHFSQNSSTQGGTTIVY